MSGKNGKNRIVEQLNLDISGLDQLALLGAHDGNLKFLEDRCGGQISVRSERLLVSGVEENLDGVKYVLEELIDRVSQGQHIDEVTLRYLWEQSSGPCEGDPLTDSDSELLLFASSSRNAVRAKTAGQCKYVKAIRDNDAVFAVGPAGTGKTFLAVVMALDYLKRQLVDRIILVRPAVEAGEQLGFLPGDLQEKINPYLRPLFDSLSDLVGTARINKYLSTGVIEASPLAYMRGRTLNNAFVILDEAQNTTVGQMKMFLTRLGFQSKVVVTGDITQIDLPDRSPSGLVHVREILKNTQGVEFVDLDGKDVMRHPLVGRIVQAFEAAENRLD